MTHNNNNGKKNAIIIDPCLTPSIPIKWRIKAIIADFENLEEPPGIDSIEVYAMNTTNDLFMKNQ